MAEIKTKNGAIARIDDADADLVEGSSWCVAGGGYAVAMIRRKIVLMHRLIMNPPEGFQVDHINGDKLDNRRVNLRICTPSQNKCNSRIYKNNRSGVKGVHFEKARKKWRADIRKCGKLRTVGRFDTLEEAKAARLLAAQELHGEFMRA